MTTVAPPEAADLSPHRWTREEFHRLGAAGVLAVDVRWELLEGEVYEKMGRGNAHITAIRAISAALRVAFGEAFDVNAQLPLR